MHLCLITAPTVTEFRSREELLSEAVREAALQPQLGILNVAAILEQHGDRPDLVDSNSAYVSYAARPGNLCADRFAEHLAELAVRSNADVYGLSSICSTYPLSIRTARAIKQLRPWATVLFGGPQASVVAEQTLAAFPFVDLVLRGEVEHSLPQLLTAVSTNYDLSEVGGLTWRDRCGTVRRNPAAPVIEDLDTIPPPAYHLSGYLRHSTNASIELGRGCPFSCTFCSTNDFFRRKFRLRSPDAVLRDMRHIAAEYGIRHFELVHDMFTVDRKRVVAFCETMLASSDNFTWDCSARTDCVDEELLTLMAGSGCRGIFFGIETGSRRMQRIIDKDLDPDRAEQILDIAQSLGIRTTASLISGYPEETWDDLRDSLRIFTHSARCALSHPQLNLLAPLAGTPVHAAHRHQLVLEDTCSDMSHQGLTQSPEDLDLIRTHPDIFPNFYLIPAPGLDRDLLFETRELLAMAVQCFRWILGAIDQSTDLLGFVEDWRAWRLPRTGNLTASQLRRYFATAHFRRDFLLFLHDHRLIEQPAVAALVGSEDLLNSPQPAAPGHLVRVYPADGEPLDPNDLPCSGGSSRVLETGCSLESVIEAIAARSALPAGELFLYTARENPDGTRSLVGISPWLAAVLRACDGTRPVAAVLEQLSQAIPEIDPADRDYAFNSLLQGAVSAGFVHLYRASPQEAQLCEV